MEARKSLPDDVPVGAVIVRNGEIIARAHNLREAGHLPCGHAEMIAAGEAAKVLGDWRLSDCDMYVTLEPCPMCAGLIRSSRIRNLYFGAYDPEEGSVGSVRNLVSPGAGVFPLILADEASAMLKNFFGELRGRTEAETGGKSEEVIDDAGDSGEDVIRKIASFTVDHRYIVPGMYISRIDGDVTTFDMRTRKPNCGEYMDNLTMHSFEHMFATYVRNSSMADEIVYFGPMGCQTGFYLLVRGTRGAPPDPAKVLDVTVETLKKIIAHRGEVFGKSEQECGNYRNLSIDAAKKEAERFLAVLERGEVTFRYPEAKADPETIRE